MMIESQAKHGEPRGRSVGASTRVEVTASPPAWDLEQCPHGTLNWEGCPYCTSNFAPLP
jgi:hypothetical protein